jgi:hypothetical protein
VAVGARGPPWVFGCDSMDEEQVGIYAAGQPVASDPRFGYGCLAAALGTKREPSTAPDIISAKRDGFESGVCCILFRLELSRSRSRVPRRFEEGDGKIEWIPLGLSRVAVCLLPPRDGRSRSCCF